MPAKRAIETRAQAPAATPSAIELSATAQRLQARNLKKALAESMDVNNSDDDSGHPLSSPFEGLYDNADDDDDRISTGTLPQQPVIVPASSPTSPSGISEVTDYNIPVREVSATPRATTGFRNVRDIEPFQASAHAESAPNAADTLTDKVDAILQQLLAINQRLDSSDRRFESYVAYMCHILRSVSLSYVK